MLYRNSRNVAASIKGSQGHALAACVDALAEEVERKFDTTVRRTERPGDGQPTGAAGGAAHDVDVDDDEPTVVDLDEGFIAL